MLVSSFYPRFNDTDALGHINNATVATWFEDARRPIFQIFIPDLDPKKWNLIIARLEIDYLAQASYTDKTEIQTTLPKIGNSSMTVEQLAIQNGTQVAKGKTIMVYFDYSLNKSIPIPSDIKQKLENL